MCSLPPSGIHWPESSAGRTTQHMLMLHNPCSGCCHNGLLCIVVVASPQFWHRWGCPWVGNWHCVISHDQVGNWHWCCLLPLLRAGSADLLSESWLCLWVVENYDFSGATYLHRKKPEMVGKGGHRWDWNWLARRRKIYVALCRFTSLHKHVA